MAQKLLVGDKDTVLLLPAFEIDGVPQAALPSTGSAIPITAPTVALLNYFISINDPADVGAHWGGNITTSIINDWELALTDSSTSSVRTLSSVGNSEELTYYNYSANMNFLRDVSPSDTASEFNLPINLTSAPDVAYLIAHRIGYSRTTATAVGQHWNLYYVWTDHAIPASSDGEYQTVGETFVPKGIINFNYGLVA